MTIRLLSTIFALLLAFTGLTARPSFGAPTPRAVLFQESAASLGEENRALSETLLSKIDEAREDCNKRYKVKLLASIKKVEASWTPEAHLVDIAYSYNASLPYGMAQDISRAILSECERKSLDPYLVAALIAQESRYEPYVVSPGGDVGLGQISPPTARSLGINPYDVSQNIEGCTYYLSTQMNRWSHSYDPSSLALASYNAGPGAVEKYGGVPPYSITLNYVAKIQANREYLIDQSRARKKQWVAKNSPKRLDVFGQAF